METVLITGAAGFIGSHLCDALLEKGYSVIGVDNFVSGRRENLAHLAQHPHFKFIEHDVTLPLESNISNLTAIFHFASPASPNPESSVSYLAHPIETLMVNSLGTKNMLELATKNDCQIILASTSEIYGDPSVHPQPESYWGHVSSTGIRSCYDEGKRFLEAISFAYYRQFQTKIKLIRIFNTYGPRMSLDDGRLIPELVKAVVQNTPFTLYGDGESSRSFCHIDDLIKGIMAVFDTAAMVGEVVNLGNPAEFSVKEAIALVEDHVGHQLEIKHVPPMSDDPKKRRPDLTKAKELLDWSPTISLADGLSSMIKEYGKT